MELLRRGSRADHGSVSMFRNTDSDISWDKTSKSVRISIPHVRDVDQRKVRYNYDLSLSIDDIQQIVRALADGAR